MTALKAHGQTLDAELKGLLQFFGEDSAQTTPEALFDLVAQFSSNLIVRSPFFSLLDDQC